MDEKAKHAAKTLAMAFGNYRAALVEADCSGSRRAYSTVVGAGEALLNLQHLLEVEVANEERVREAIDYARQCVEGDEWGAK